MDLAFILDSSGSIGASNWPRLLTFVVDVISRLPIGRDRVNVGVVSYGNRAQVHFDLDDHLTVEGMERAIQSIRWKDQMTNTSGGIMVAQNTIFTREGGNREGVPNVAIVITDGIPNLDGHRTVPQATRAKSLGTELFLVGVGNNLDLSELDLMVSEPAYRHLFLTRSFNLLYRLQNTFLTLICDRSGMCLIVTLNNTVIHQHCHSLALSFNIIVIHYYSHSI